MSGHPTPSLSPEPGVRHDDKSRGPNASTTPSPRPSPSSALAQHDSVTLDVYDRVSHGSFRVRIYDPIFLRILNNSVVPAAESDGALPFELHEFVTYVDAYERERVHQLAVAAMAAKRGTAASSGSLGYVSGGLFTSNAGVLSGSSVHSDPSTVAMSATTAPAKLEDTLRQTLSENSDFFFRLASVAYQLEPNPSGAATYTAAQVTPSPTGATGTGIRGGQQPVSTALASTSSSSHTPAGSGGTAAATTGASIVSAAASGMTSMLAGALPTPTVPVAPHRNYAVDSGYSAAFHLCGRLFAAVYHDHCHALAERISANFSALRLEDCVKFNKAVWAGFHLKALDPLRSATRSESNLEVRWMSEKIKDDKHLFPYGGADQPQQPQQQQQQQATTSHLSRIVDATLSYVANGRQRTQSARSRAPTDSLNGAAANGSLSAGRNGVDSTATAAAAAAAAGGGGGGGAVGMNGGAQADSSGAPENELQTYGLTKLLHNPSWQKDEESSDACPSCGRGFLSVGRPLGARAHHCRSCGVRLCVFCITKRAHYSFAKLTKPGSVDEAEERFVCDVCYREYEATRQLHYLGALFAFAGLGFSDLVLCRTVNEQWREAAELCISEYRLLLHNCDADLHSVLTPVGVLLMNSVYLLLGKGPTPTISVVHHPEAALLLLKFIATENLWRQDFSYYFIQRLSQSILNRADMVLTGLPGSAAASAGLVMDGKAAESFQLPVVPTLSHWHLFCTAFCSRISSSFFFVKCAELLCAAPMKVFDDYLADALERMTRLYLCTTRLWKRLARANQETAAAFRNGLQHAPQQQQKKGDASTSSATSGSLPLPTLADTTESQLVTIWLLDMLHKDALVPPARRRYQGLLDRVLPTVATSSLSLVFVMLLSLTSNYGFYNYDEELFVLWRTRILAELARVDAEACDRVAATLDFYSELDHFCAQSVAVNQASVVEWILRYCARGRGSAAAAPLSSSANAATRPSLRQRYVDLPHPMLNPFKPYMVLRSIRLSGVRVAPNAATKPIWLAFSTWTAAEHAAHDEASRAAEAVASATVAQAATAAATTAAESASPPPVPAHECMFLYKRENVERDQLMCISSRLLQMLLASEIGGAEMLDYSVLPLSCDSGLIEKAAGRELSNLENMDITSYVLHRGQQGCANFLASAKLFLLLNYIFSIGDRHKGNVLIGSNGALLHIDFRFIFSEKTFVEKLARSTVRIDDAFLAAVEECQLRQSAAEGRPPFGSAPSSPFARHTAAAAASPTSPGGPHRKTESAPTPAELRTAFFDSAAEWFVHVRPFAAIFYELWLYAVHRHTVPYSEKELLMMLNTLFDRHASQASSASKFSTTMKESVNVCRLKDVTHSSAEVLRSFTDQVSRRVSESGAGAVKMVGNMWSSWWTRAA